MRIKSVKRVTLPEPVPVYDLSVPGTQNFKLEGGPHVHNCFVGDTQIECVDGEIRTLEFLEFAYKTMGLEYEGWTWDSAINCARAAVLKNPRVTKTVYRLIEVVLSNNAKFTCTHDHRWMVEDGSYVEATNLLVGTALKAFGVLTVRSLTNVRYDPPIPVYDVTVEGTENFSLLNGPFVHNSKDCLVGSTKIPLLSGESVPLQDLLGKEVWVYGCTSDGKVVPAKARNIHRVSTEPVVRVTLDTGRYIDCTPDHEFMLRDGSYLEAGKLAPGQSLMPLYRNVSQADSKSALNGYEQVWCNQLQEYVYTHQRVAQKVVYRLLKSSGLTAKELKEKYVNHKVVSVIALPTPVGVYDMTVDSTHNFATEAGVFVHNCADALAGVVYGLTMRKEIWLGHGENPRGSSSVSAEFEGITDVVSTDKVGPLHRRTR